MGLRFRKSIKVAPGVKVNLGKKSASVSVGTKGARYTVSSTGKKTTSVGIPGTGASYVTSTGGAKHTAGNGSSGTGYSPRTYKVCGVIFYILAAICLLLGLPTIAFGGWLFLLIGVPSFFAGRHYIKLSRE